MNIYRVGKNKYVGHLNNISLKNSSKQNKAYFADNIYESLIAMEYVHQCVIKCMQSSEKSISGSKLCKFKSFLLKAFMLIYISLQTC